MKIYTLVNLLDIHNEGSLIAAAKFNPRKVIYLINNNNSNLYSGIENYYKERYPKIQIEDILINEGDVKKIKKILKELDCESTVVNITGGKRIDSLILLNEALKLNFNVIYVDVLNKQWYKFGKDLTRSSDEFIDIDLKDMLNIAGADLVIDSSDLAKKEDILDITKYIYSNIKTWYKYKKKLHDTNIFIHDTNNTNLIYINTNYLNEEESIILYKCLNYMGKMNILRYEVKGSQIQTLFIKNYVKAFIFKSGTWLEVLTDVVVREITEIDEVKSGVVFLWRDGNHKVRNEVDVMAVKDSVLICISCKDSEKYDEVALNELDVYSKRLGGNSAKKILVATRPPCKKCVEERAKAMDINLVILDEDINKFKKKLNKIING